MAMFKIFAWKSKIISDGGVMVVLSYLVQRYVANFIQNISLILDFLAILLIFSFHGKVSGAATLRFAHETLSSQAESKTQLFNFGMQN